MSVTAQARALLQTTGSRRVTHTDGDDTAVVARAYDLVPGEQIDTEDGPFDIVWLSMSDPNIDHPTVTLHGQGADGSTWIMLSRHELVTVTRQSLRWNI